MFEICTHPPAFIELDKVDAILKSMTSPSFIMEGEKCTGIIDGYDFCIGPMKFSVRSRDVQYKRCPSFEEFVELVRQSKMSPLKKAMFEEQNRLETEKRNKENANGNS